MTRPTIEAFQKSAREALTRVCDQDEPAFAALDELGPEFDFKDDGGIDSLDILDVVFYIDKDLGVKIFLESMILDDKPITLQNLYDAIREDATTPA